MKCQFGPATFEAEGKYLTLSLRESNDILRDSAALIERLSEDGYLFLRSIHDRDAVIEARRSILSRLQQRGALDLNAPLMDGVIHPKAEKLTSSVRGNDALKTDELRAVINGLPIMELFERLFASPVASFNYQWLRAAGTGASSGIHCDAPFMSRGSRDLLTCWTPLGDITPEMGPLAICMGSHHWEHVMRTYGQSDVDRDLTTGAIADDPAELVDAFGGRWATSDFRMGDIVIFGMYNIHASLTNITDRIRISCDTRYQPATDPIDERWSGDTPQGHDRFWAADAKLEPTSASRKKWGL